MLSSSHLLTLMIFQTSNAARRLGPSETDMLWRPWMRNLATDLEGFVQAHVV